MQRFYYLKYKLWGKVQTSLLFGSAQRGHKRRSEQMRAMEVCVLLVAFFFVNYSFNIPDQTINFR